MKKNKRDKHIGKRLAIDIAGFGLILISPLLGWLPGPGGIPVFLAGVAILSRNYDWAENLLKNFEKKRIDFVNTYLMGNKKVARIIDVLSLVIIIMALLAFLSLENPVLKLMSLGAGSFAFFIIISNQKRLDRAFNRLFKRNRT